MVSCARFSPLLAVLLLAFASGCSSSEPSTAPEDRASDADASARPALSLLYTTEDGGLALHDARDDATETLDRGVASTGARAVSPSGQFLAFSYATGDSTHLALLDLAAATLQRVHARSGAVTYSLAWHPSDDRLAFAYYEPVEEGTRGPGSVHISDAAGSHRSVGCRAAREVLAWLPDGSLAARDDDTLYRVDATDCATQASADARRMHEAAYAPNGSRLAYIHRELSYDREAGEYTPDSSLYLSDARGGNATEVLGPERRTRHLRWSPTGAELAVDVRPEGAERRQIAIYREEAGRTVFLTPPSSTTTPQTHPRWSPDGNRVAFTSGRADNASAAVRMQGQTRLLGPVDGAVWGWLDDEALVVPGPDSVRVQTLTGDTRYSHPAPAVLLHAWEQDPT